MPSANVHTPYLTIAEVAEGPRASKMAVYRLIQTYAQSSMRYGKSYRITEKALEGPQENQRSGRTLMGLARSGGVPL